MINVDEEKNKGGRPKAKIDLKQVEALAGLQATYPEMAAVLGVSESTVGHKMQQPNSGFCKAYKKGKEKGKISLRRLQWKTAQGQEVIAFKCRKTSKVTFASPCTNTTQNKCLDCSGPIQILRHQAGNPGMQIWLGKQWLEQAEKHEVAGKDGGPLTTSNTNTTITGSMTDKQAAAAYAQMIKGGNG